MINLRLIFGTQLSESSLIDLNKNTDYILMCELMSEAQQVKHHKKKLVLNFASMRHFAASLLERGYNVSYVKIDAEGNTGCWEGELRRFLSNNLVTNISLVRPNDYKLLQQVLTWKDKLHITINLLDDKNFLCSTTEFAQWAGDKKQLRMENFYRLMRQRYNILMEGDKPVGGKWNYDNLNRNSASDDLNIPDCYKEQPDNITREVITVVGKLFPNHFGDLEPFHFAVTRQQAVLVLRHFIRQRLTLFGQYQDAMLQNEPWMYHSHISFYLNIGLLLPMECITAAVEAYDNGMAPLNAVEGFVRQVLGWREYIRGIYWLKMPGYEKENFFNADNSLPKFYWSGKTAMNCLAQTIAETKKNAYAHHIQRLMVLGNFALIAGIKPEEVNEWFLVVYADAYEWVELPNVSGMILFADGGYLASKPYAAGGSYINKMSNYCKGCIYSVAVKTGENACPFNYLYWDFLARNIDKLSGNHRLRMIYSTYNKMSAEKKQDIDNSSATFILRMNQGLDV